MPVSLMGMKAQTVGLLSPRKFFEKISAKPVFGTACRIENHKKGIEYNHMDEEYQIDYVDKPEESAWGIIGRGIGTYNEQQAGEQKFQRLCFALHAPGQEMAGGVLGEIYWDWFHLDLLWVKDELRGRGYGHRLLLRAEDEARQRGAKNVFLDTFSFQAPDFYKRHGYQVFGALQDFPPGHQRYFLTKQL